MNGTNLLSTTLITTLHSCGLHVIWDIVVAKRSTPFYTHWKVVAAICLSTHLISEWKSHINNFKLSGIILLTTEDYLVWAKGTHLDKLIVKEAYFLIAVPPCPNLMHPWLARSSKWNLPLKLKCFSWLVVHNC